MTPEEREQEKGQQRRKRLASASRPSQNRLSSDTSQGTQDIKWLIITKHPVSWQQKNPKALGSVSGQRYENYKVAKTLNEALELGPTRGD